jgi:ADP-ribosyl-[dinitrogen reductase] hydrolase
MSRRPTGLTAAQTDRACGALIGSAAGDALGAGYEFARLPADLVPTMIGGGLGDFAPGEWTDDTSMAWAIADVAATGVDLRTSEALDAIAARFRAWYDTRPPDIGINTSTVLRAAGAAPSGATLTAAAQGEQDATGHTGGNGSLMRTAAVGLAHLDDPAAVVEAAMAISALTHADPRAQEACALWSLAIRHAVLEGEYDVRSGLALLSTEAAGFWSDRLDEAEQYEPGTFNPNGYVVSALQAAWSAIVHTPIPTEIEPDETQPCAQLVTALENAVRIGNDTDTVAAIAGALLGARWGMSAVPAAWRRILHGYPGLTGMDLERLAYLTARGGRSGKYGWPLVDHIDYRDLQYGRPAVVRHPHDPGVWLAGATALDDLPPTSTRWSASA